MEHIGDPVDLKLLNDWQRNLPIEPRPFLKMGQAAGRSEADVLRRLEVLKASGRISRVGATCAPNTVSASTLAAVAAPAGPHRERCRNHRKTARHQPFLSKGKSLEPVVRRHRARPRSCRWCLEGNPHADRIAGPGPASGSPVQCRSRLFPELADEPATRAQAGSSGAPAGGAISTSCRCSQAACPLSSSPTSGSPKC